ncbi:hypothetical protein [Endozoicomonas numazuensis]|uniref:Uncharacterized protein n=1 Tax=Endozoicomonas numazuensis TaxID=1137799 RepID=A0A081N6G4_9GAMM|nr:hypothetical protein [Endozoicomonas numazuensis]KEQ14037.1 hypothetical protein GZ78_25705 [Endozoicomonas numazuensis]
MKFRVISRIILLSLSLLSSLAFAKTISDNLVLVVYESNAEVNMVLASADNPGKVLASSVASPVHVSYSQSPGEEDFFEASVSGTGHPGSLAGRDSETILFANALDNLRKSTRFHWPDLKDDDRIRLNAVFVGIAGFNENQEKTLQVDGKAMTKGQYIRKNMKKVLNLRHFITPIDKLVQIDSDTRLIGKLAKQKAGEESELRDLDFIQLSTYAIGHKIRDGILQDDRVTYNSEGGDFQFGIKIQEGFLNQLPDSCTASDFDRLDLKHIPALKAMNAMPTVDVYEQVPKDDYLFYPNLGYSEVEQARLNKALPRRAYDHLFVRLKTKKNEAGYLGFWVLQQNTVPEGVTESDWIDGQTTLNECAKATFIPAIKRVVEGLGEEGIGKNQKGANVPLFMVGEFPVGQVLRLRDALNETLSEEDLKRIVWMKPLHYRQFLATAGIKLLKKNGFKPKQRKAKEDNS